MIHSKIPKGLVYLRSSTFLRNQAYNKLVTSPFHSCFKRYQLNTSSPNLIPTLSPTIREVILCNQVGETVTVRGWVKTARRQKKLMFVDITDGTCTDPLQIFFSQLDQFAEEDLKNLTTGCSIQFTGELQTNPSKKDIIEIHGQSFIVLGNSNAKTYPLQKKAHGAEFLGALGHLRPRTSRMQALFRLRSEAEFAIQAVLKSQRFTQVHTPIITSHDCEGGGEVFQVQAPKKDFFEFPAYLTVSGQLHLEMAANAIARVYTLGPTFRAEPSVTGRHLSEFWMLEAEVAFLSTLDPLLDLTEALIRQTTKLVLDSSETDIDYFDKASVEPGKLKELLVNIVSQPFKRLTYDEAIQILKKAVTVNKMVFEHSPVWGHPLQSEHEHYLSEKCCLGPVFVTNYPQEIKPFYMKLDNVTSPKTVSCFDLLIPGVGELVGGSLREDNVDMLSENISKLGDGSLLSEYQWYLDLRRYGSAPHGGFGLGLERFIQFLSATPHIRDLTPYPRYVGNCRY